MIETATLAGGCFWCTEAIYKRVKGVIDVEPGYAGGKVENPTYEQVCSGMTGYAEAIKIQFDNEQIGFEKILEIFFGTHDSRTLNRQGNDVGTQYRSAIFYHDEKQKEAAIKSKSLINESVTEIVPFTNFYVAEDYHKNYFENHKDTAYCSFVIAPKVKKLAEKFGNELKNSVDS